MKNTYLPIGSISSGTMRSEDLIPSFMSALESVDKAKAQALRDDNADIFAWLDGDHEDDEPEFTSEFINETLWNALNEFCPPYCYFGSNPGDGADYGVWVIEEIQEQMNDDGERIVTDLGDLPPFHTGTVLHISDHGNMELYAYDNGNATSLWSVV
jgi:hypothetical protein